MIKRTEQRGAPRPIRCKPSIELPPRVLCRHRGQRHAVQARGQSWSDRPDSAVPRTPFTESRLSGSIARPASTPATNAASACAAPATRSARRSASALPAAPREIATTTTFKHRKNELARDGYDPGMTSDQLCFSDPKRTPSYRLTACSTAKSVPAACVSRLRAALSLTSECRRLGLQTQ